MDLEFAINELTEEFYINYEECKSLNEGENICRAYVLY